jgi:prepilin-type N-terminal cleavage/methylation domain-containing protein
MNAQDHDTSKPGRKLGFRQGFTLVEVVVAVGIVAIAIPAILGTLGIFSRVSDGLVTRWDTAAVMSRFSLYLDGMLVDAARGDTVAFDDVYGWVRNASADPPVNQVLYAYKTDVNQAGYSISRNAPVNLVTWGKILAAEVHAPTSEMVSEGALVADAADYEKCYLPLQLQVHALSGPAQTTQRTAATYVDAQSHMLFR